MSPRLPLPDRHVDSRDSVAICARDAIEARQVARVVTGLIASFGLVVCTLVSAMAISMGFAKAASVTTVVEDDSTVFAIALLLGLLFVAASISKMMAPRRRLHGE